MNRCPDWFQERVTRAGGTNRYGEPNFKLVWSREATHRAGGVWVHDHYAGYREVYLANGSPYPPKDGYWMLLEWTPPEQYGSETGWFFLHRDETTGLSTLGSYPHKGRYEIAVKLIWTTFDEGTMTIEPWPLNSKIIDMIIPVILAGKKDSILRRKQFAAAEKARTEKKVEAAIEAVIHNSKRKLLPSKIEDRIRLLEKQWTSYLKNPKQFQRGLQQV